MSLSGKISKRRNSGAVLLGTFMVPVAFSAASQSTSATKVIQDVAASGAKILNNQNSGSRWVPKILGCVILAGIIVFIGAALVYLRKKNKELQKKEQELNNTVKDLQNEKQELQKSLDKSLNKNKEMQKVLDKNSLDLNKFEKDNTSLKEENENLKSTLLNKDVKKFSRLLINSEPNVSINPSERKEKVTLTVEKNVNFNITNRVKNGYKDGNISRNEKEIKEKFEGLEEKTFCVTKKDVLSLPFRSGEKEEMEEILKDFEDGEEFFLFVEDSRFSFLSFGLINKKTNMAVLKDKKYYIVSLDYDRKILDLLSGKEDKTRRGVFENAFLRRAANNVCRERFKKIISSSSEWYKNKIIEINKKELENIMNITCIMDNMEKVKKITSDKDTLFVMIDDVSKCACYLSFYIVDEKGNKKSPFLFSKCATESTEKLEAFKKYFIENAKTLEEKQDLNLVVNGDNISNS